MALSVLLLSLCGLGVLAEDNTSAELRLVGGASRCEGTVEVKHEGDWRRVRTSDSWDLEAVAAVCRDLDCGSALSGGRKGGFPQCPVWEISPGCVKKKSKVKGCIWSRKSFSDWGLDVKCSDSVRLVSGSSPCSGSVQIWDKSWTWVCEGALDLQSAEVLCRELDCGPPSLFQGALSPLGQQTFHCEGYESALKNCSRSSSRTCSSGAAVNLTCSEPLRLVGGASHCAGAVEVKRRGNWGRVVTSDTWDLEATAAVCRDLDCGSAVSGEDRDGFPSRLVWEISPDCVKNSTVKECVRSEHSYSDWGLDVVCSDSVRLVSGSSPCSGSVQIWDKSWTWVCEGALDLQSAEVLCRELDCGPPSLFQGALSPLEQQTFHCEGCESALKNCSRSSSRTCSSGAAVNLTCSELRLVGGASHCAGAVEVKLSGNWGRVVTSDTWDLEATAAVCRDLDCGSAVSGEDRDGFPSRLVWEISPDCVKNSTVKECVRSEHSYSDWGLDVVCSDSLNHPIISLSVIDGVSEAEPQGVRVLLGSKFSVKCSVEPQFPGGSFQLLSPTVDPTQNHTLPAVNHSAHFLFSDAGPAHTGNYTCVYHLQVFNHTFSSQSTTLQLSLGDLISNLIIRVLVILLLKLMYILPLYYYYCKASAPEGALARGPSCEGSGP